MTRDELIEALLVERYDNRWWKTPEPTQSSDDDLTIARRRREMAADFDALDRPAREAR